MQRKKLIPTTKAIDEFLALYEDGRLDLTPDFQRNGVWPVAAKAYLIDTILEEMPIPLIFLARERDSNSGKLRYRVIDGQQRIRAALEFRLNRLRIPNEYRIQKTRGGFWDRVAFEHLPDELKERFIGYSFVVMELSGYSEEELREIFVRINKYVVKLNPQEMRGAAPRGQFRELVDEITKDEVWGSLKLFSDSHVARKRDKEFIAELVLLMLEGPQDKKGSLDLYYSANAEQLGPVSAISKEVLGAAKLVLRIFDGPPPALLRRLPAFYGLMGATFSWLSREGGEQAIVARLKELRRSLESFADAFEKLPDFNPALLPPENDPNAVSLYNFQRSVSRQTDNVLPRNQRIAVIQRLFEAAIG